MEQRKAPLWLIGLLVGALLTVSLIALSFLGSQILGLPFVAFEFFDWLGRVLPGGIVVNMIETIVSVIRGLNLGDTDSTAKLIEQMLGLGTFLMIGTVIVG